MAGAAEGVWLDSESIHPITSDGTIGISSRNLAICLAASYREPRF
jgi:hypothetical protein